MDRYEVEAVLGQGGMATVYKVCHTELMTRHALKLLMHKGGSLADRMLQEGKMQARLRHPNVVGVTDVVRHEGHIGLVMDFIDGVALGAFSYNYHLKGHKLDQLAHDLFDGIEAAHALGLVHRDLKPDNVMMAFEGDEVVAKITDFGLAKALSDELRVARATQAGQMMGTPRYMAPEQFFDAAAVDVRADIYALGAILYEVLGRKPLFPDSDLANALTACVTGDWEPLTDLPAGTPAAWRDTIHACLATAKKDRPADIAALRSLWGAAPPRRPAWSADDLSFLHDVQDLVSEKLSTPKQAKEQVDDAVAKVGEVRARARPAAPGRPGWHRWVLAASAGALAMTALWVGLAGASLAWVSWEASESAEAPPSPDPESVEP